MNAVSLYPSQCELGEGPLWHESKQSCFWVDITNGSLFCLDFNTKEIRKWKFNFNVTLVLETTGDHVLLALNTSIARFNTETEEITWLFDLEEGIKNHRCNDGACDSKGRLWVGTTHNDHEFEKGFLYLVDEQSVAHKKIDKVTISNGLTWSPDNKYFYFIDSPTQTVASYFYDENSGNIHFDRTAITVPEKLGTPDGMTIDSEGMLWIAHWGGFGVYRWNPFNGELLSKIDVPAPHVTSCAFAGKALDQLIITTARKNMSDTDLLKYPESGNIFIAQPGFKGLSGNKCKL